MHSKKFRRRVLPITMAAIMVASCFPAMAAPAAETAPVDFITAWNEDGTIKDIDMEKYAYYVAAGQALKNAPAFTNAGTVEEGRNENNLFGQLDDAYGYLCEDVWNLEKEGGALHAEYGTWSTYWALNGDLITEQMKATDSIAWLADTENTDNEVTAPHWYVRHGSLDRDTSFANQTLLYMALSQDSAIENLNFKFAYGQGHSGNYDNAEAFAFIEKVAGGFTAGDALALPETATSTTTAIGCYFDDVEQTTVKRYTDYYLTATKDVTDEQYKNAKVNIYYDEAKATSNSPVLYLVNNSGWMSNSYDETLIATYPTEIEKRGEKVTLGKYDTDANGKESLAAKAIAAGYIVVDAGLRNRNMDNTNSPVTVADCKAVVRYLRDLGVGDTEKIIISGTSGGGALSVAMGASGNADLYDAELEKIGAVMDQDDDVYAVVAYCPITDLGHADGSYEYTYAAVRQMFLDNGYNAETTGDYIISDVTMGVSPKLAAAWANYVNKLGVAGENSFDVKTLKASGDLQDQAEELLIAALNEGLAKAGSKDAFLAELAKRTVDKAYSKEAPETEKPSTDDGKESPKTGAASGMLPMVIASIAAVAGASVRGRKLR